MSNALIIAGSEAAIAGVALWGWGLVIRGLAGGRPTSAPLTIALGLGGVIFLGGVLNALGVAYPGVLNAMILVGFAAVVPKLVKMGARGPGGGRADLRGGWALVPILAAGWFVAAHLVPQKSYNIYDDFEKYFAYPVKMLATGTLGGNRLSAIGGETLGGQAFLQGFVVAHLPPAYLGTLDTFLGLLLCVALAGFAVAPGAGLAAALVAEFAVIVLNPEIININSVFTGAALVMAVVFLSGESEDSGPAPAAWLGLLYAGLIALKTTFLLFAVIHPLLLALARAGVERRGSAGWRTALSSLIWTGVFLSPWILLSASHYWAAWHAATISIPPSGQEVFSLISMRPELYGGTQAGHTAVAGAALLVAMFGLGAAWLGALRPSPALAAAIAGLATAGVTYFVLVLGLHPFFGHEGATRYGCPIVIGTIPAAMRLWGGLDWKSGIRRWVPIGLLALAVAAFLPCAVARIRQVARYDTPLAFFRPSEIAPAFIAYNREVLWGEAQKRLTAVQQLVPPQALILTWVSNPFWLDFKRNPVVETNPAGLGSRWAWPPVANYFLWEYRGYAVKYPGMVAWTPADYAKIFYGECAMDRVNSARALGFVLYLEDQGKKAQVLYNDGKLMLFRMHP